MELLVVAVLVALVYFFFKSKSNENKPTRRSNLYRTQFSGPVQESEPGRFSEASVKPEFKIKQDQTDKPAETDLNDIVGFHTFKSYSPNKEFIVTCVGGVNNEKGTVSVVRNNTLLFKKAFSRPYDCHISDTGISICCDWTHSEKLTGIFKIMNLEGNIIFSKKTSANLGCSAISRDGLFALFETYHSETSDRNKIFIIDIANLKIHGKFDRDFSFNNAEFPDGNERIKFINHKGIVYETDLLGKHINFKEMKSQILLKGDLVDKIYYFEGNEPINNKERNDFITILEQGLNDENASYAFGKDKIYRKIGEQYEVLGNNEKVIENWQNALRLNEKVGIKKKLEQLQKKYTVIADTNI